MTTERYATTEELYEATLTLTSEEAECLDTLTSSYREHLPYHDKLIALGFAIQEGEYTHITGIGIRAADMIFG